MPLPRYLRATPQPIAPRATAVAETLRRDPTLGQLTTQARAAQARLETVKRAITPTLRTVVAAGGIDESGWTLLAKHAAAAAKLRQIKPKLQQLLFEQFGDRELRIKVLAPED